MTTVRALSKQFWTANLRQLQSRFQTAKHRSQRAHRLPFCTLLCQTISWQNVTDLHSNGANQQSSKAAKQSLGSKCMFSESCLHCYQMRLPHTNQINQQLPIFINLPGHRLILTSIELHQVFVNNRGDLRAPRNQCQTGSRILQMSIHSTLFQLHYGPP